VTAADAELLREQGRTLTKYHLMKGSTAPECVGEREGIADLTPIPGLIGVTYDLPDMITLDDSPYEARAIMPCGHVISEQLFTVFFCLHSTNLQYCLRCCSYCCDYFKLCRACCTLEFSGWHITYLLLFLDFFCITL